MFLSALTEQQSKALLTHEGAENEKLMVFRLVQSAFDANDNALSDPRLRAEIDKGFDIVIVSPFIASEAGYYVAERTKAHLVLYATTQVSFSFMNWAMGQPHNPAYMPFAMLDLKLPFTFLERIINTVATASFHAVRYYALYLI